MHTDRLVGILLASTKFCRRRHLRRTIDGRDDVRGHGRREMPIWGLVFQQRGRDADQEAEVAARIDDLVAYLETLQGNGE